MSTGTRLAVIGDVHAHWPRLERVLERLRGERLDGVLLVGDLGSHDLSYAKRRTPERDARYLASVAELLERTRALGAPVAYVPGNHDLPTLDLEGNLDGRVGEIGGLAVGGIGGAGPGRFGFAYEWEEDAIRARADLACDVLLVHTPPARTPLDLLHDRVRHVGSEAIRERAERHRGLLVCGHIHESAGCAILDRCLCFNVGGLGEPFGRAQVGLVERGAAGWSAVLEDLEGGTIRRWEHPA